MARIRSVHPGQWTDEDFVSLSFAARLLAIAIRNESDDRGVFEWKPVRIKLRLFPGDSVDVPALLDELLEHGQVMRFEIDGKPYGAIRNFCDFQRPKKPSYFCAAPAEVLSYVGFDETKGGTEPEPPGGGEEPVPNQFRTSSEISPQKEGREEGKGKKEDPDSQRQHSTAAREAAAAPPLRADAPTIDLGERFAETVGARNEPGWALAGLACARWLQAGATPELLIGIAEAHRRSGKAPPASPQWFDRRVASEIARLAAPLPEAEPSAQAPPGTVVRIDFDNVIAAALAERKPRHA